MQRAQTAVFSVFILGWLAGTGGAQAPQSRRVEVTASRYAFTPSEITVRQGETVELVLRSLDTEHGLEVKAYKLKVGIPKGGAEVTASFQAGQPGRYPMTCSEYCGSGHRRMRGELVVTGASE